MFFTSFNFFLFFPCVVILYYLIPHRFQWLFLLIASSLFYAVFSWGYLLFLFVVILLNFVIGLNIYLPNGQLNRPVYLSGILINILILCFYKYFNYLNIDIKAAAGFLHLHYPDSVLNIIFPIGLSYFVFTSLSYLIDIKREVIKPESHIGIFASYFLFFPKIIQGPIERAGRLMPQFHETHIPEAAGIKDGLILMAWGFFKKLVIADNLAIPVNAVFSDPGHANGPTSIVAIILFGIQLYADFSGYTDIALGSARILGFDLTQNFRRPFLSKSVRDFWTRWHISLSSWCSDYVFLPVLTYSYSLKKMLKKTKYLKSLSAEKIMYVVAAFITFLIIGVWHGVGWNYIVVGFLFGFFVSFDIVTRDFRKKVNAGTGLLKLPLVYTATQIFTTFILVNFVWIFFRTDTLTNAGLLIRDLFHGWSYGEIRDHYLFYSRMGLNGAQLVAGIVATVLLIFWDAMSEKKDMFERIYQSPVYLRWVFYYFITLSTILFSAPESRQFFYLQF